MHLFVLTPIYETSTTGTGATPVVHYFAREWVKLGNRVTVLHFIAKYPAPFYWFARLFKHRLDSRLGIPVPVSSPTREDYVADGVEVHRIPLFKLLPHRRYFRKQIRLAEAFAASMCSSKGVPDIFVGHWDNPQLELLSALKDRFSRPTALVLHSNEFHLERTYGENTGPLLGSLDVVGFRNNRALEDYESKYGRVRHPFIAYSGVSSLFLSAGETLDRDFEKPIRHFVFVGLLIERKYPTEVLKAPLG